VVYGFDWNQYNRKHFNPTNLPPKVIQGYRFHLFYPDLIDITISPIYYCQKDKKK